ncbi:MAG: TolC family protein [Flavobacteriales bacterium]|nr:TolC family protein [Flavobacteriales bacterium]
MKNIFLYSLLLVSAYCSGQGITIDTCYAHARANYPAIIQKDLIAKTKGYDLSNASKAYIPHLSLSAQATYQSEVTSLPITLPGMEIPSLPKDQYKAVLEINQTVWDGGVTGNQKKTISAQSDLSQANIDVTLYTVRERVNGLFFGILMQDEILAQNIILQKDLKQNIERIEVMMKNGVANRTDLEMMTVELIGAQRTEVEIKATRKAYIQMLSIFTAIPMDENTVLLSPSKELFTANGEIRRPELSVFAAQEEVLNRQERASYSAIKPKIGVFVQGGYGRPGLNMLASNFKEYYMAGVNLKWDISGWYTLKNNRNKIEISRQTVASNKDVFLQNTHLQMAQQIIEIEKYTPILKQDQQIVSLRTSIRRASETKYENGVISTTDLIRDINAEASARTQQTSHHIARLMSIYNYIYTTNNTL